MPDKDGDDEKKSTKSVVNKKQKQMMGEMKQQKKIIPSGQGLTDYSKVPKVTGLGGGGGGTDSITDVAKTKSLGKRIGDVAKIATFPFHKRRVDPTEKFASEEFIPEEGYDIARDMGKVRPSKDKKDATTLPVSKEMRKTQKVNKGPSAFERVKAKYGKSVMNVGKKKVNEELDLTQVAEAFGGYIVESEIRKIGGKTYIYPSKGEEKKAKKVVRQFQKKGSKPKSKPSSNIDDFIASDNPFSPEKGAAKAKQVAQKQIEKDTDDDPRFSDERKEREGQFSTGPTGQKFKEPVTGTSQAKGFTPKAGTQRFAEFPGAGRVKIIKKGTKPKSSTPPPKLTSDQIRASQDVKKQQKGKDRIIDVDAGETTSELEKTASAKIEKPKPKPSKIGQFQGPQMTALQKSNRFNRPSIAEPKNITGANPEIGQSMFMRPGVLNKSGKPRKLEKASPVELRQTRQAVKDLENDPKEKTIISPKTGGKLPADSRQATQYYKQSDDYKVRVQGINPKTGKKFNMSDPDDRNAYYKAIGSSKRVEVKNQDSAITRTGGITRVGTPTKKGSLVSQSPITKTVAKATNFVKKNPATAFLTLDAIRKYLPSRSPFGVVGGRAGTRSAAR